LSKQITKLKASMDKNTPICKSVCFSLIELIIYIALCMIQAVIMPSVQNQPFFVRSFINFLNGYLPLIAAIATTWYVVFTYYLMKSTIEFNQQLSTPFANVSWEICRGKPEYQAEAFSGPERVSRRSSDKVAPTSETESVWAVIIINNLRSKQISSVVGKIKVRCQSEAWSPRSFEARFDIQHLRIDRDNSIKIGIEDISLVPSDVMKWASFQDQS